MKAVAYRSHRPRGVPAIDGFSVMLVVAIYGTCQEPVN